MTMTAENARFPRGIMDVDHDEGLIWQDPPVQHLRLWLSFSSYTSRHLRVFCTSIGAMSDNAKAE